MRGLTMNDPRPAAQWLPDLRVESTRAAFHLAAGTILDRSADHTLVTESATRVSIHLSSHGVSIQFNPAVRFVIHPGGTGGLLAHLVEDVRWSRAMYRFGVAGRPPLPEPPTPTGPPRVQSQAQNRHRGEVARFRQAHPSRVQLGLERVPAWTAFDAATARVRTMVEESV
jgi:hypothetical protein